MAARRGESHNEKHPRQSAGANYRQMKHTTNSLKRFTLCLAALAGVFTLASCDSKQENAREDAADKKADTIENKADAVRDNGEKKADAIEENKSMSNDHSTNQAMENKADGTRDAADATADKMENKADAVRDMSPTPTP